MDLGFTELLMLAFIGVMLLGPKETMRIAYSIGKWVKKVRGVSQEFMTELTREADLSDLREETKKIEKALIANEPAYRDEDMQNYHKLIDDDKIHDGPPEYVAPIRNDEPMGALSAGSTSEVAQAPRGNAQVPSEVAQTPVGNAQAPVESANPFTRPIGDVNADKMD